MTRHTRDCRIETADTTWRARVPAGPRRPVLDVAHGHSATGRRSGGSAEDLRPRQRPSSTGRRRQLLTVLFVDIVGSTQMALRLGDDAWCDRLVRYHRAAHEVVGAGGGRVVNTAGDGFLAVFGTAGDAVRSAVAMRREVNELGMTSRAGIHTAEVEVLHSGDVIGIGIHVGARVSQAALAEEIWVSRTARDLLDGSGFVLAGRGQHWLPGFDETWELFAVES